MASLREDLSPKSLDSPVFECRSVKATIASRNQRIREFPSHIFKRFSEDEAIGYEGNFF